MDEEKLKELTQSERYISGIYNYCDRWCEKCNYTSVCLSFEMSKESFDGKAILTDKKFWKDLENSFKVVKNMLNEYMKEHNISLPTDEENAKIESEMKKVDKLVKADPILLEAQNYNMNASNLLKENNYFTPDPSILREEENEIEILNKLHDVIEVILFYKNLIFVKISRALHSYYSTDAQENEAYEEDKLVSARIAVVAVERSMSSWHYLFENCKYCSDNIIDILLQLNKIKLKIEKLIPGVANYRRPYFD
jgi:hypothetical protein